MDNCNDLIQFREKTTQTNGTAQSLSGDGSSTSRGRPVPALEQMCGRRCFFRVSISILWFRFCWHVIIYSDDQCALKIVRLVSHLYYIGYWGSTNSPMF